MAHRVARGEWIVASNRCEREMNRYEEMSRDGAGEWVVHRDRAVNRPESGRGVIRALPKKGDRPLPHCDLRAGLTFGRGSVPYFGQSRVFRNSNKTAEERGTVPICSADYANLGQSPTVLLELLSIRVVR